MTAQFPVLMQALEYKHDGERPKPILLVKWCGQQNIHPSIYNFNGSIYRFLQTAISFLPI